MVSKPIFTGAATALITPFTKNGIDEAAFGRLIDWQIESGIDALVIAGTTGEAATMTAEEYKSVLSFAAKRIARRVPAIAGTGTNCTQKSIENCLLAAELGYDAALVVTPYYNKATQNGLVQSFSAIADASPIPLVLYNVPGRTGISIKPQTYAKLAEHPNIAAIKEASGDLSAFMDTMYLVKNRLHVYSGNDDQVVPFMAMGGLGVISVLSDVLPKETSEMCHLALEGKISEAAEMQLKYLPLIHALFSEVNPIPAKAALSKMGYCENILRLPLTSMEKETEQKLEAVMKELNLL